MIKLYQKGIALYQRGIALVSGRWVEAVALLLTRIALAGVFWRSGRTKVEEDSWLTLSDTTYYLFAEEYSGVPLPAEIGAPLATYGEHFFPILLVLGLATRLSAMALLGMTLVIQIFVYPDAWWTTHIIWMALAAILVTRGGGLFSADTLVARLVARSRV